jgi:hypothetical protein
MKELFNIKSIQKRQKLIFHYLHEQGEYLLLFTVKLCVGHLNPYANNLFPWSGQLTPPPPPSQWDSVPALVYTNISNNTYREI